MEEYFFFPGTGETSFTWECYVLFSEGKGEMRMLFLASAVFRVPLAQNNPYAKVAYFGVAYSATVVMKINEIKSWYLPHSRCST